MPYKAEAPKGLIVRSQGFCRGGVEAAELVIKAFSCIQCPNLAKYNQGKLLGTNLFSIALAP